MENELDGRDLQDPDRIGPDLPDHSRAVLLDDGLVIPTFLLRGHPDCTIRSVPRAPAPVERKSEILAPTKPAEVPEWKLTDAEIAKRRKKETEFQAWVDAGRPGSGSKRKFKSGVRKSVRARRRRGT